MPACAPHAGFLALQFACKCRHKKYVSETNSHLRGESQRCALRARTADERVERAEEGMSVDGCSVGPWTDEDRSAYYSQMKELRMARAWRELWEAARSIARYGGYYVTVKGPQGLTTKWVKR